MIIQDKVGFVTGGAQGIGRAICEALLKKGAKVIIADINVTEGKSTASELATEYADNVTFIECDVTNQESVEDALRKSHDTYGRLDIIGNNAGVMMENDPIGTINLNLCGVMRVAAVAMSYMRADNGGSGGIIVNTASYAGIMPYVVCPSYCASKHGVVGFTRSIAMSPDFDLHKVRMNCLCPDAVDTAMVRRVSKEGEKKGFIFHYDHIKEAVNQLLLKPSAVADVFINLVEDESKNGSAMLISRKGPPRDIEFPIYQ
ncbi:15-hydroxyprostaglandin dehydrogenase [NAD(+)]-like [Lingula anatina]|uniref:15-hydroxyprostaglandin dehydrogenase [NAD(+)] n=1 Tax=Lingula anatina TaxID=7574 RepID=A0A1S3GXH0_LINAN|nr:15-hydroxyprostaglandin dehydrogenase [NAD(+)]-like [Lingula anatina]|eukprot:XP_013378560.1 15-hydroxyprostaglandin dehydrogenase [NAD(+)]-like [Lingula anatina]